MSLFHNASYKAEENCLRSSSAGQLHLDILDFKYPTKRLEPAAPITKMKHLVVGTLFGNHPSNTPLSSAL
jgi:hypothetical protein